MQAHPAAGFGGVALQDGAVEADQGVVGHVGIVGQAGLEFGLKVDGFGFGLVLTAPAFLGGAVAQGRDAHAVAVADDGGGFPGQIVGPGAGPGGVGGAVMAGSGPGLALGKDAGAFLVDRSAVGVVCRIVSGPVVGPVALVGGVGVVRVHGVLPQSQPASVRGRRGDAGRMTVAAGRVLERRGFVAGDVRVGGPSCAFLLPLREKVPPEKGADEGSLGRLPESLPPPQR